LRLSKLPSAPSSELGLQNFQSTFKSQITEIISAPNKKDIWQISRLPWDKLNNRL